MARRLDFQSSVSEFEPRLGYHFKGIHMKRFKEFINEADGMSSYTCHHPNGESRTFKWYKDATDNEVKGRAAAIHNAFRYGHPKDFKVDRH